MPNQSKLEILIEVEAKIEELKNAIGGIDDATSSVNKLHEQGEGLVAMFAEGLGFGTATEVVAKFTEGIERAFEAVKEFFTEGIHFNAEVQSAQLGIAGIFTQFSQNGGVANFTAELQQSGHVIDLLREKANELGLDFGGLLESYKTTAGALFRAGITDLQQQVDLTVKISAALRSINITGFQASRETSDIFNGLASRTEGGRILNLDDKDIDAAKQAGTLYDYMSEKLAGFSAATEASANTFQSQVERMKNETQQLAGALTQPIFQPLTDQIAEFNKALSSPDLMAKVSTFGEEIRTLFQGGKEGLAKGNNPVLDALEEIGIKVANLLPGVQAMKQGFNLLFGESIDASALAAQSQQLQKMVISFNEQIRGAHDLADQEKIRASLQSSITDIMERIRTGQLQDNDLNRDNLNLLVQMVLNFDKMAGTAKEVVSSAASENAELEKSVGLMERKNALKQAEIDLKTAQLAGDVAAAAAAQNQIDNAKSSAAGETAAGEIKGAGPAADDARENAWVAAAKLVDEENALTASAKQQNAQQKENEQSLSRQIELEKIRVDQAKFSNPDAAADTSRLNVLEQQKTYLQAYNAELDLSHDKTKAVAAADEAVLVLKQKQSLENEKIGNQLTKHTVELEKQASALAKQLQEVKGRLALSEKQNQIAAIQGDPFMSMADKEAAILPLLQQEQNLLDSQIAALKEKIALYAASSDPQVQANVMKMQEDLQQAELHKIQIGQQAAVMTPQGQWETAWRDYFDKLGSMAQQTAHLMQSALDNSVSSISSAITAGITGTKNWGDAFREAGNQIINQLLQMSIQWALQNALQLASHGIMETGAAIGQAIRAQDVAAHEAAEATKAAASLPSAVLTSVSSYGVAAAVGLAAVVAVLAATKGFDGGGYTGDGGKYEPAGMVHRGEYVFTKEQTERIGAANLERIANTPVPHLAGYALGGLVGPGSEERLQPLRAPGAGASQVHVAGPKINVVNLRSRSEVISHLQSAEGQTVIADAVRKEAYNLGIFG